MTASPTPEDTLDELSKLAAQALATLRATQQLDPK